MKTNLIVLYLLILISMIGSGCSKQLDVSPQNAVPQSSLGVSDIAQLRTGMYSNMEDINFLFAFDFDKRGENLQGGPGFALVDPVSMTPADADITSMWQNAYKSISTINFLIETINKLGSNASSAITAYKGEALYFRALTYYNLVTRWGGVPIVLTNTNTIVPRSTEAQVWAQIKSDLTVSRSLVSAYSNNFYVSDQAVKSLMARTYLATGDNPHAILYADSVINFSSSKFALATDSASYSSIFISGGTSKEIIFALANNSTANQHLYYSAVNDTKATWTYSPSSFTYNNLLLDVTSPVIRKNDKRKSAVFSADPTRAIKFPNGKAGQQLVASAVPASTPIIISRLAEMYLIKAEAQGPATGAATLTAYFADRYKTPPTTTSITNLTAAQYEDMILNEERREFYCEGHWWYDIKRSGRTDLLTSLAGRTYLLYYPIPQVEKDLAGYTQNPGY